LPPVHRTEDAAHLGRRQQSFEHPVAVLPEPQHAIAGREPVGPQGIGEPVHPVVHLWEREAIVAAHERVASGIAPPVLAEDVPEGQRVQEVHGPSLTPCSASDRMGPCRRSLTPTATCTSPGHCGPTTPTPEIGARPCVSPM